MDNFNIICDFLHWHLTNRRGTYTYGPAPHRKYRTGGNSNRRRYK